jgi:hypothetical protein
MIRYEKGNHVSIKFITHLNLRVKESIFLLRNICKHLTNYITHNPPNYHRASNFTGLYMHVYILKFSKKLMLMYLTVHLCTYISI